jgi:hypothetical protein
MDEEVDSDVDVMCNPYGSYGDVPLNPIASTAPIAPGTLGSTPSTMDAQGAVDASGATASDTPIVRTPEVERLPKPTAFNTATTPTGDTDPDEDIRRGRRRGPA